MNMMLDQTTLDAPEVTRAELWFVDPGLGCTGWRIATFGPARRDSEGVTTRRRESRVYTDEQEASAAWFGLACRPPAAMHPGFRAATPAAAS